MREAGAAPEPPGPQPQCSVIAQNLSPRGPGGDTPPPPPSAWALPGSCLDGVGTRPAWHSDGHSTAPTPVFPGGSSRPWRGLLPNVSASPPASCPVSNVTGPPRHLCKGPSSHQHLASQGEPSQAPQLGQWLRPPCPFTVQNKPLGSVARPLRPPEILWSETGQQHRGWPGGESF